MLQAAEKILFVREHREGRGAVGGVGAGEGHRVKRTGEHPPRRRALLDLGDQPDAGRRARPERPPEVAGGRGILRPGLELAPRGLPLPADDFVALVPDDLPEHPHGTTQ